MTTNTEVTEQNFLNQFEVVQHVTLPTLKQDDYFKDHKQLFVRVDGQIHQAEQTGKPKLDENGKPVPAPNIMHVTNLLDKRPYTLVANTVLSSELQKAYPEHSYVGKAFSISRNTLQGKRYKTYEIIEIRPKGQAPESAKKPATNK